jgi:anti-sigma B factor antagonist
MPRCEIRVVPADSGGGTAVMLLKGDVDGDAKVVLPAAYAEAVASHEPECVRLDFTDVEYINSTGLAVIVGVLAQARADRRSISAAGLTDHYKHIFTVTRLVDFISLVEPVAP